MTMWRVLALIAHPAYQMDTTLESEFTMYYMKLLTKREIERGVSST